MTGARGWPTALPSIRYGVPLLIIAFTALLAAYTEHRDRMAAEALVRGQAVVVMSDRMQQLQGLFDRASQRGIVADAVKALTLAVAEPQLLLADPETVILSASQPELIGRRLRDVDAASSRRTVGEPLDEAVDRVRSGGSGEIHFSMSGRAIIGIYPIRLAAADVTQADRTGVLIVRRDLSRDLEQARADAKRNTGEIVAMLIFLAALLGLTIHYLVTRRLGALMDITVRFAAGDLDARSCLRGGDEVATLGEAFNRMAARVSGTQRSLEQRVQARTADLARLVEELRTEVEERRRTEIALSNEKERIQITLASLGDAVITTDPAGRIEYLNPAAEQLTGWSCSDATGVILEQVFQIVDELDRVPLPDPVQDCISHQQIVIASTPTLLLRSDHTELSIDYSAAPVRNHEGAVVGAVLISRDVTEARHAARQLSYQASHDALTGLLNRREFERRLTQALSSSRGEDAHSVLYLDLDQFKIVNDTCGHAAGDELLRQISGVLSPMVRKSDTLARLGGDEFGVLLENCPQDRALRIAQNVRKALEDFRFVWQNRSFSIGASVGLVPIDPEIDSVASIFKAADIACYAAKDQGRNRVHVYQHDDRELAARHGEMQWVPRLQQAVADDRFVLYYQPIIALVGDSQTHGEILLRLRDEDDEALVMPSKFIPAAERYNQMQSIDRWVVRSVFAALRDAAAPPPSLLVAINLSGQSISDANFLHFIEEQIEISGVPLEHICFEVTETAAISNLSYASRFFSALKPRGCRFALDDFGSGLSSFAYLKTLPVDFLKIDGAFVRDMVRDPIDDAMVEAIHRIGHVMGIETIAECVESRWAIERLKAIGVNYVQGYALGKPRPFSAGGEADHRDALDRPRSRRRH